MKKRQTAMTRATTGNPLVVTTNREPTTTPLSADQYTIDASGNTSAVQQGEEYDPSLTSPFYLFLIGFLALVASVGSNIIQGFTSFTAYIGMQDNDILKKYGFGQGSLVVVRDHLPHVIIAGVIAVLAQIGMIISSQMISKQWKQKVVLEHAERRQALAEIVTSADIGEIIGLVSVVACAISDYTFITLYDANIILMIFWGILLSGFSTWALVKSVEWLWAGWSALESWLLWRSALKRAFDAMAEQQAAEYQQQQYAAGQ